MEEAFTLDEGLARRGKVAALTGKSFMDSSMIETLTSHSAPARLPHKDTARLEQRNWAIRLTNNVHGDWNAHDASAQLTEAA